MKEWSSVIDNETTLFWFRRDLRLDDNAALYHALKNHRSVLCVFIFDTNILEQLEEHDDARVTFIYDTVLSLKEELEKLGSSLLIVHDKPEEFFKQITPQVVYTNHDYEPYAISRDELIRKTLEKKGVGLHTYKDQVVFEKSEVTKDNGEPYTVFTPYSKKWKSKLSAYLLKSYPTLKYAASLKQLAPLLTPTLEKIGFSRSNVVIPERILSLKIVEDYHKTRDVPSIRGTSRLGLHLRFGTISIRKAVQIALKKNETWLNELIWREFYQMILFHFPHVARSCFKPEYDNISWRNDAEDFDRWCNGTTGYPLVDAGMRELNATGFMHNRVRMVAASFLTKHLLVDWRWGEAYFAKKLLDFDLASNNGGWQWAAGCGCDAAPYFRVFNPALQMEKFDKDLLYVRRWVPEYQTDAYPQPIIDHATARERVMKVYKRALNKV